MARLPKQKSKRTTPSKRDPIAPPSTIQIFNQNSVFHSYTPSQTCLLLTLCQISGFSADHIAILLHSTTNHRPKAEEIWHFHWQWVIKRNRDTAKSSEEGEDIMRIALREAGIVLEKRGEPLNTRPLPITIPYMSEVSYGNERQSKMEGVVDDKATTPESGLLAGWTKRDREESKQYLINSPKVNVGSVPTPFEEKVFTAVGGEIASILRYVLKRWHKAMRMSLDRHSLKPIRVDRQIQLVMEYLGWYHREYEAACGLMEKRDKAQTPPKGMITIRSTGHAVEIFLGIIMADRVWALNQKRKALCQSQGFVSVETTTLKGDDKYCAICCDELGVANPEGAIENPVRIVTCCHQVFGENCLKIWLKENWKTFDRDTCPNCRFKFPGTFLRKLLGKEWKRKRNGGDDDDEDSEDDEDDDQGSESDQNEQSRSGDSAEESEESEASSEHTPTPIADSRPSTSHTTEQFVNIVVAEEGLPFAEPVSAEVDTPMTNTQDYDGAHVEVAEVIEVAVTAVQLTETDAVASVERDDDFMLEG